MSDPSTPTPAGTRKVNGFAYHRDGCACNPCRRKRGEPIDPRQTRKGTRDGAPQAVSGGDRERGAPLDAGAMIVRHAEDVINADNPLVVEVHSIRSRVAQWVAMRAKEPDITMAEASRRMGLSDRTLGTFIKRGTKEGWLKFEDPLERIEHEIIPRAIDVMRDELADGNAKVAIEVGKGTIFPMFREAKGIHDASHTILALKVEMPTVENMRTPTGIVVGVGRSLDVDVQES